MSIKSNFVLMALYNQWINKSIYDSAAQLSPERLSRDDGAFFQSISGTLNHILVGDIIWLQRFADHPDSFASLQYLRDFDFPKSLDAILYPDFEALRTAREEMDATIVEFIDEVSEDSLEVALAYQSTEGEAHSKKLGFLVQHLFNHQTHHRGQVTTLLSQAGIDVGLTDLLPSIPEEKSAVNDSNPGQ